MSKLSLASLVSRATARRGRSFAFGETAAPLLPALPAKTGFTRNGTPAASTGRARRPSARQRSCGGPPRRAGGFTLLELLLAFVVFALSFATVLEILSGSMRNTVKARQFTEAALTAQSVMDQVGLEIPLQSGYAAVGESGDYRWEIELFDYVDSGENPHSVELAELTGVQLLQVELQVSWGEPPREQSSRFSTVKAMLANRERVIR